jgi:hypothetical protein
VGDSGFLKNLALSDEPKLGVEGRDVFLGVQKHWPISYECECVRHQSLSVALTPAVLSHHHPTETFRNSVMLGRNFFVVNNPKISNHAAGVSDPQVPGAGVSISSIKFFFGDFLF